MFRARRYRAFVAFAVIAIFAVYHFSRVRDWHPATAIGAGSLKQFGIYLPTTSVAPQAAPLPPKETQNVAEYPVQKSVKDVAKEDAPSTSAPALVPVAKSSRKPIQAQTSARPATVLGNVPEHRPYKPTNPSNDLSEIGEGRLEVKPISSLPKVHWTQQTEHFPVVSTIQLPRGSPKPIPRIQFDFKQETEAEAADRKPKLKLIVDAASHAWSGYKENAWGHDEVRPVTGGSRDPFCGWAATLVDALDTLWIMGMKDEFEEAVRTVGEIDFTTSTRKDIPLFETTIRYLGGLLAAYDVSNAKYRTLLEKAVELAEILMGAFDTPNRMPVTYYHWMPTFASQPHRAGTRVVLAELGSLSLEFTRLAQITKEPKYYDAIDRITDAFEEWQTRAENGTLLPGMWPVQVDASGCEKPTQMKPAVTASVVKPIDEQLEKQAGQQVKIDATGEDATADAAAKKLPTAAGALDVAAPLAPLVAGLPGKTKILGWNEHFIEGDLDSEAAKAKLLGSGDTASQSEDAVMKAGSPGVGKIVGWGDPIEEGSLDGKTVTSQPLNTVGSQKQEPPFPADPLEDKLISPGASESQSEGAAMRAGSPGKGKIVGWGNPIEEGSLDGKTITSQPLDTLGSQKQEAPPAAAESLNADSSESQKQDPPLRAGSPGKGKILGWGDPIEEGSLDTKEAKEQLFSVEGSETEDMSVTAESLNAGSSESQKQDPPLRAGSPGRGKILGWGDPIEEGSLDTKEAKEQLLNEDSFGAIKQKRQLDIVLSANKNAPNSQQRNAHEVTSNLQSQVQSVSKSEADVCIAKGLDAASKFSNQAFTLGGMADSTYEYLPKEYLLLGGLEEKYRTMYEQSMDAAIDKLLYRPMTPDDADVLFAGEWVAYQDQEMWGKAGFLKAQGAHLTCFTGGMFALGAKIFNRKQDLELAAKLTEGCVWAYNATATGIMPEDFTLLACEDMTDCHWNETRYWEALDPYRASRAGTEAPQSPRRTPLPLPPAPNSVPDPTPQADTAVRRPAAANSPLQKRQLDFEPALHPQAGSPVQAVPAPAAASSEESIWIPPPPPTHEEYVLARIAAERLPPGFVKLASAKYILRPEAIESVFYMYRITGDSHWRDVGWRMFEAVEKHTQVAFGHSAIDDVTKDTPEHMDTEESFWLAETLKYFFLLFSEPDVVSLDEWVLNTEAHPFRRPDAV